MTTTRDNTPAGAPPPSEQEGAAPTTGAAPPMLTTEQRLERIEQKLDVLVAAIGTVASETVEPIREVAQSLAAVGQAAHLVADAVQNEGLGGLVKMLPVLMRGG